MKTYLELPHMLPVAVTQCVDNPKMVRIEQPDPDLDSEFILLHRDQVEAVIEALREFLVDTQ